ncbi:hypothetical protein AAHE18_04G010500 [Arachis hypogaea]
MTKLLGYNFEVRYKEGGKNRVLDALSQKFQLSSLSVASGMEWDKLEDEVHRDEKLRDVVQILLKGEEVPVGFELKNIRLLYKGRLGNPKNSKWIPKLLQEFHDREPASLLVLLYSLTLMPTSSLLVPTPISKLKKRSKFCYY